MSEWLEFEDMSMPNRKTKILRVTNKSEGDNLGDIIWDCGWRQYVFDDGSIKLGLSCLEDLAEKIRELKKLREDEKK